jgi:hypothetical protein
LDLQKDITLPGDISGRTIPLNTIRSNPEIVPLTKFENLFIKDFMSRLLLLNG